jgi:hypothetical protein
MSNRNSEVRQNTTQKTAIGTTMQMGILINMTGKGSPCICPQVHVVRAQAKAMIAA